MRKRTNPADVKSLAEKWMRKADPEGKRYSAKAALIWAEAAGDDIARHTKGIAVREGELIVYVDSSAWANELAAMSEQLRARVNAALGKSPVRSIRFTVSRQVKKEADVVLAERASDPDGRQSEDDSKALSEQERLQVEYAASGIGDEVLRQAAIRAMTRDLEWKKGSRTRDGREEAPE